uniref:Uncharacterized protein n=1 Tax=Caenorhabditis tropicalis TaxID=1561998 RepID=A0A1I7TMG2_9PELO
MFHSPFVLSKETSKVHKYSQRQQLQVKRGISPTHSPSTTTTFKQLKQPTSTTPGPIQSAKFNDTSTRSTTRHSRSSQQRSTQSPIPERSSHSTTSHVFPVIHERLGTVSIRGWEVSLAHTNRAQTTGGYAYITARRTNAMPVDHQR